jgi:dTDP-4-amino-4,6-dideoxygalactose transaminase
MEKYQTTIEEYAARIRAAHERRQKTKVPYADLNRIYQKEKYHIDNAIQQCIDNSWFIKGPKVEQFEENLSKYCNASAVGVSSGTSALLLAYESLGLKAGDKIVVPSFTFMSTPEMASKLGLTVVWVDCNLQNYTIDLEHLEVILSRNDDIRCIVGVDMFGHPCDWDAIKLLAKNIPLVQDAAQSFGSTYKKQITGSYVDLTCFSFYPAKNMFCYGDGGAERYDKRLKTDTMVRNKEEYFNVYNQYTIRVNNRDEVRKKLKAKGIDTGIMWPIPCHQQPAYASTRYLPNTEKVSKEILSLPMFPYITNYEIDWIADNVNELI